MSSPPQTTRVYGGKSAEERRRARRERLIAAGLELFGTAGVRNTSIRAVLREAGLAERYFYESFATLDDLFAAVYDEVLQRVLSETIAAVDAAGDDPALQIRAGLQAFTKSATADPRAARIQLIEVMAAGPDMVDRGRSVLNAFAAFIHERMASGGPDTPLDLYALATGLSGAVHQLLSEWILGRQDLTLDQLTDHCIAIFEAVQAQIVQPSGR